MTVVVGKTPIEVENERIESALADVCGTVNVVSARVCGLVSEALVSGAWEGWGLASPEHWVRLQLGASSAHASRVVAVARRWGELPVTMAVFGAGGLSFDQVAVIAKAIPAYADAEVAELAQSATVSQLSRIVNRYTWPDTDTDTHTDTGGGGGDAESGPERSTRFDTDEGGGWNLRARLCPEEGAVAEAALAAKRDELFNNRETGDNTEVSWSDALMGIFEDFLAGRTAAARDHRDRYLTLVHLETNPTGGPVAGFHLGDRLPDSLRRYLGCDGRIKPVFEVDGVAVSVGRAERIVPDRTRRIVEHRDGGCRVPGCGRRRWLHVHHIVHWEDGGATDTANLCCLCPQHHRMHHRDRLDINGNPDHPEGLAFRDQRGRPLGPRPPNPGTDPATWPTGHWHHPTGEPCQYKWVQFSDPPNRN